ncbi:MAG TPA: Plug domain-containing protein, partial [Candidatus Elarobacter sp.]|nr:Plug domain-containing protein [Candidatus Elarobacter sp.]
MTNRHARAGLAIAAALVAALAPRAARAQVPSGDTLSKPSLPPKQQRADSVQARIGRDHAMPTLDIGEPFTFDRDALFRTGALTLGDLLDRIPAVTAFRSGWIAAPQVVSYGGDFSRVRVFFDGIEMDDLEPRNGVAPDLHTIPIWALQQLTLVRSANELRIDLRTWEYNLTTPYTRVDVLTGDVNTNLYRAFYGKRYYNGAGLQVMGEQYGVNDNRTASGGNQLTLLGRYGIARRLWSIDATAMRMNITRSSTPRFNFQTQTQGLAAGMALPNYRAANSLGYIRAAVGQEGSGPFVQLVASTQILREYSAHEDTIAAKQFGFLPDTVDSLASATQYVATAGFDAYGGRLRLIDRYRRRLGKGYNSPSATFDLTNRILSLQAIAEHDAYAGLTRTEAGARFLPLPFVAVSGWVGQRSPFGEPAPGFFRQPRSRSATLEGGLRLQSAGLWASGGVVTRDGSLLDPPTVYDSAFVTVAQGRQTGAIGEVHGPLFWGFNLDVVGTHWKTVVPYAPQNQAHTELRYYTQWLSKFPDGNFSFLFQPGLDWRGRVVFPTASGTKVAAAAGIYS